MTNQDAIREAAREALEDWLYSQRGRETIADAVHDAVTQWLRNEGGPVIRDAVFNAQLALHT